jgi:hypothetical protein
MIMDRAGRQAAAGRAVTEPDRPAPALTAPGAPPAGAAGSSQPPPGSPPAGPAALSRRWLAVARRHWLATALLAAGLALRVLAELAYRPALFYLDTARYLYNADGNDPVGYKAPLRAILAVGDFNAVTAVQHLLGLAMALILYVLLLRRGASRWLAALAIAPVLLDAYQLQTEQTIMPGSWFEALIVAGLAILLWRPDASWRRAAAAGLVLGTSATIAQVGEALILPAVIYVLAQGGGWRRAGGRAAALVAAFAVPILAYCTGSYLLTGGFFLSHQGATSFYGRTAAAADCGTIRLPPAERGLCPTRAQQARGSDWLEYGQGSPVRPYYAPGFPRAEADHLISDFNTRVLTQQPLRVLRAYAGDAVKLFAVTRRTRPGDTPISRWQFRTSFPYFYPHATRKDVLAAILQFGGGQPAVWRPVAAFLRGYQLRGGYTPGPLLLLFTITGLAGSAAALRRRSDPRARQPALACLLFFTAAVALLGVSDLFIFSWRYQLPALVTLAPAGALGIGVIAGWARSWRVAG